MRASFALLAFVTGVLAQIPGLPSCAQGCINLPAGCSTTDFRCICADKSFITNISCCVSTSCDAADQATIIKFAAGLCGGYGVTVPSQAGCSASSAPSSAASASPAGSGSGSGASSAQPSVTAFAITANGTTVTTTATVSVTTTATTAASSSASGSAAASTGGAASVGLNVEAMLGAWVAGMALL